MVRQVLFWGLLCILFSSCKKDDNDIVVSPDIIGIYKGGALDWGKIDAGGNEFEGVDEQASFSIKSAGEEKIRVDINTGSDIKYKSFELTLASKALLEGGIYNYVYSNNAGKEDFNNLFSIIISISAETNGAVIKVRKSEFSNEESLNYFEELYLTGWK